VNEPGLEVVIGGEAAGWPAPLCGHMGSPFFGALLLRG
jgi:hypothetical protein